MWGLRDHFDAFGMTLQDRASGDPYSKYGMLASWRSVMLVHLDEPALAVRRQELLAQIAHLGDLRPGSLLERHKVYGRASCWCIQSGTRSHSSQWILATKILGKTRTRHPAPSIGRHPRPDRRLAAVARPNGRTSHCQ